MDWHSLSGNLLANGLWALVVLGGGGLFAYLRAKHTDKVPVALYGLAGATCISILIFTFTGRGLFSPKPSVAAPDNIEQNVKVWAEDLGMSIGPAVSEVEPNLAFAYTLRLAKGVDDPVNVFRSTIDKPGYLQFKALYNVPPESQAAFSKMTQPQVIRIMHQLDMEIGLANLGCTFGQMTAVNDQLHQTVIAGAFLQRGVQIETLNEERFADTFDQLTRGVGLVRSYMLLAAGNEMPKSGQFPIVTFH